MALGGMFTDRNNMTQIQFYFNNIDINEAISNNDNDTGGMIRANIELKAEKRHLKTYIERQM